MEEHQRELCNENIKQARLQVFLPSVFFPLLNYYMYSVYQTCALRVQ